MSSEERPIPVQDFHFNFPNGLIQFREDHLQRYAPRLQNTLEAHLPLTPDVPGASIQFRALKCLASFLHHGWYHTGKRGRSKKCLRQNSELEAADVHLAVNILSIEVGIPELEYYSLGQLEDTLHRLPEQMIEDHASSSLSSGEEEGKECSSGKNTPSPPPSLPIPKYEISQLEQFAENALFSGRTVVSPALTFTLLAWAWGLRGEKQGHFLGLAIHKMTMAQGMRMPNTPPMSPLQQLGGHGHGFPVGFPPYGMPPPALPNLNEFMSLPQVDTIESRLAQSTPQPFLPPHMMPAPYIPPGSPAPPFIPSQSPSPFQASHSPLPYLPEHSPIPFLHSQSPSPFQAPTSPFRPPSSPPPSQKHSPSSLIPSHAIHEHLNSRPHLRTPSPAPPLYRADIFSPLSQIPSPVSSKASPKRTSEHTLPILTEEKLEQHNHNNSHHDLTAALNNLSQQMNSSPSSLAPSFRSKTPSLSSSPDSIADSDESDDEEYNDEIPKGFEEFLEQRLREFMGEVERAVKAVREENDHHRHQIHHHQPEPSMKSEDVKRLEALVEGIEARAMERETELSNQFSQQLGSHLQETENKLSSSFSNRAWELEVASATLQGGLTAKVEVVEAGFGEKIGKVEEGVRRELDQKLMELRMEEERRQQESREHMRRLEARIEEMARRDDAREEAERTLERELRILDGKILQLRYENRTVMDAYAAEFTELAEQVDHRFIDIVREGTEQRRHVAKLQNEVLGVENEVLGVKMEVEGMRGKMERVVGVEEMVPARELKMEVEELRKAIENVVVREELVGAERRAAEETKRVEDSILRTRKEILDNFDELHYNLDNDIKRFESKLDILEKQDSPSTVIPADLQTQLDNLTHHINYITSSNSTFFTNIDQDLSDLKLRLTGQETICLSGQASLTESLRSAIEQLDRESKTRAQELSSSIDAGLRDQMQKFQFAMHDGARQILKRVKKHVSKSNEALAKEFNSVVAERSRTAVEMVEKVGSKFEGLDLQVSEESSRIDDLQSEFRKMRMSIDDFNSAAREMHELVRQENRNMNALEEIMELIDEKVSILQDQQVGFDEKVGVLESRQSYIEDKAVELSEQNEAIGEAIVHMLSMEDRLEKIEEEQDTTRNIQQEEGGVEEEVKALRSVIGELEVGLKDIEGRRLEGLERVKEEVESVEQRLGYVEGRVLDFEKTVERKVDEERVSELERSIEKRMDEAREENISVIGIVRSQVHDLEERLDELHNNSAEAFDIANRELDVITEHFAVSDSKMEELRQDATAIEILREQLAYFEEKVEEVSKLSYDDVESVKEQVGILSGRIGGQNDRLAMVEQTVALMQPVVDSLNTKCSDMDNWVTTFEDKVSIIGTSNQESEDSERIVELEARVKDVESRTKTCEHHLHGVKNSILDLDHNQEVQEKETNELRQELHEVTEGLTSIMDTLEILKMVESTLEQRVETAKDELSDRITKVEELAVEGDKSVTDRMESLVSEHAHLFNQLSTSVEQSSNSLNRRLNDLSEKHATTSHVLDTFQTSFTQTLESAQLALNESMENINLNYRNLMDTVNGLHTRVNSMDGDVNDLHKDVATIHDRCDTLYDETTSLTEQISTVVNNNHLQTSALAETKESITTITQDVLSTSNSLKRQYNLIAQVNKYVTNLSHAHSELRSAVEKHSGHITGLNTTVNTLNSAAGRVTKEIETLKETRKQAKALMTALGEQRVCACEERHRRKEGSGGGRGSSRERGLKRKKSIVKFSGV